MKRTIFAAVATYAMTAPCAAPAFADQGYGNCGSCNQRNDHRDDHTVVVVKHDKNAWRDNRPNGRWDGARHNGYYVKNVCRFGPPPAHVHGYVLGYKPWARGDRLGDYSNRYREVDYRVIHQIAPPRGYHYVRDDKTGEIILATIATGIIASIIVNN